MSETMEIARTIAAMGRQLRQLGLTARQEKHVDTLLAAADALMDSIGATPEHAPPLSSPLPEPLSAPPSVPPSVPDAKPRVLLVEDNEINQEIACELLRDLGVDVTVADNGERAVEAARSGLYGIIFMDIEMPVMDGLEAARRIRASGTPWAEQVPIVAMTAHAPGGDGEHGPMAAMNAHVTKPIAPQILRQVLDTWLPRRAAGPDAAEDAGSGGEPARLYGVNTAAGTANVAGNDKLYFDLLRRFAAKYRDSRHELPALLEQGDTESASRLAHTIKGVAANLGVMRLADIMKKIEAALLAGEPIAHLLGPYADELDQVIRAIERETDAAPKAGENAPIVAVDAAALPRILEALEVLPQLMLTDWGQAQEMVEGLAPLLGPTPVGPAYARLCDALEEFDAAAFAAEAEALARQLR